jgi:hypothetical protein
MKEPHADTRAGPECIPGTKLPPHHANAPALPFKGNPIMIAASPWPVKGWRPERQGRQRNGHLTPLTMKFTDWRTVLGDDYYRILMSGDEMKIGR